MKKEVKKNLIPVWLREGIIYWDADEKEYLVSLHIGTGSSKIISFKGKGEDELR